MDFTLGYTDPEGHCMRLHLAAPVPHPFCNQYRFWHIAFRAGRSSPDSSIKGGIIREASMAAGAPSHPHSAILQATLEEHQTRDLGEDIKSCL